MSFTVPAGHENDFDSSGEFDDLELFDSDDFKEEPTAAAVRENGICIQKSIAVTENSNKTSELKLRDIENAMCGNDSETVKNLLLETQVEPDTVLNSGWSLLMHAAYFGSSKIIDILIEHGADANFSNGTKDTALHMACNSNCPDIKHQVFEVVKSLVDKGANTMAQNSSGKTPLMFAARRNLMEVVKFFVDDDSAKENFQLQDDKGWSVVDWAAAYGHTEILAMIFNAGVTLSGDLPSSKHWAENVKEFVKEHTSTLALSHQDNHLNEPMQCAVKTNAPGESSLSTIPDESNKVDSKDSQTISVCEDIDAKSNNNMSLNSIDDDTDDSLVLKATVSKGKLDNQEYEMYGQLELFLLGLELSHLIPVFKDQDVKFEQLLCLSMEELELIGISAFGTRKRIMTAIHECHEKHTQASNLMDYTKSPLTTASLLQMVSGASEQVEYISSCLRYIKYHIEMYPDTLKPEPNVKYDESPLAVYRKKVKMLNSSLCSLGRSLAPLEFQAEKMEGNYPDVDFTPPGIINRCRTNENGNCYLVLFAAVLTVSSFVVWKKLNHLT